MRKVKTAPSSQVSKAPARRRPAQSDEARQNQCIALAFDLVEQRLRDGTATSQETTYFLKLGSKKEKTEQEILELQRELVKAKTKAYQSADELKELYADAIKAFTEYTGEIDE